MYNSYHFVLYGNTINTEKEANDCKKIKKNYFDRKSRLKLKNI